jgi:hypothetical protein
MISKSPDATINFPPHSDELVSELYAAADAIFFVNPEDDAAIDAVFERMGDAAEALGLPRDHLFSDGTSNKDSLT